jgi:hypothetical protein
MTIENVGTYCPTVRLSDITQRNRALIVIFSLQVNTGPSEMSNIYKLTTATSTSLSRILRLLNDDKFYHQFLFYSNVFFTMRDKADKMRDSYRQKLSEAGVRYQGF